VAGKSQSIFGDPSLPPKGLLDSSEITVFKAIAKRQMSGLPRG